MDQASREAVKGAEKNVLKSLVKGAVRKSPIAAAALATVGSRNVENFKSLKDVERGKMSKGLRQVKPLPADIPRPKTKPKPKPKVPRPKKKPVGPETMEFLRIKNDGGMARKTRVF